MQVDAFTTHQLGGNPCAIVFDSANIPDATMQAIAKEMNLSETSFVWRMDDGRFRARYFTPAEEIPLAGHPTIATIFSLVETGRVTIDGDYLKMPLILRDGPIDVEIFTKDGKVQRVVMSQRKPQFLQIYAPEDVLPVFGLDAGDLLPGAVIQTVSTGTPQLFIPVCGLDALRKIKLDVERYIGLRTRSDFFSAHVFCLHGVELGDTFARHFVTPPDLVEDPYTGSATGGMGAYLWHYGLIQTPTFTAEQGHWMGRPGEGVVEVIGPADAIETVKVGGAAATILRGELIL
jgi:trans-2,3-dihydro-3-hydroxyanthranilate isomerase